MTGIWGQDMSGLLNQLLMNSPWRIGIAPGVWEGKLWVGERITSQLWAKAGRWKLAGPEHGK